MHTNPAVQTQILSTTKGLFHSYGSRLVLPSFNMMFCRRFPLGSWVQAVVFELSEGCPCVSHPLCSQRDLSACMEWLWLTALPWIRTEQNKVEQEKEQYEMGEITAELDRKGKIRQNREWEEKTRWSRTPDFTALISKCTAMATREPPCGAEDKCSNIHLLEHCALVQYFPHVQIHIYVVFQRIMLHYICSWGID